MTTWTKKNSRKIPKFLESWYYPLFSRSVVILLIFLAYFAIKIKAIYTLEYTYSVSPSGGKQTFPFAGRFWPQFKVGISRFQDHHWRRYVRLSRAWRSPWPDGGCRRCLSKTTVPARTDGCRAKFLPSVARPAYNYPQLKVIWEMLA